MLHALRLTPNPSHGPWFLLGEPHFCANGVGHSGMSREPGETGPAHRGWDGDKRVHTDIRLHEDRRGAWWVGAGAGGSAGVLGSWQGQAAGRGQDRQS